MYDDLIQKLLLYEKYEVEAIFLISDTFLDLFKVLPRKHTCIFYILIII